MQSSFAETQPADGPVFVSLGMLVLDELQFPFKETLYDVPGGSGAYSTLGARLATPTAQSKTVACILLTGDDFPASVLDQLQAWNITLQIHRIPGKKSTRGLLQYSDAQFDRKTFRYLTPPLAPSPADHLQGSPLLHAATFHTLADPAELSAQVSSLLSLRNNDAATASDDRRRRPPIIIWEPRPPSCTAANLDAHVRACDKVDVFSPNHVELLALFGEKGDYDGGGGGGGGAFDRGRVEACARRFLDAAAAGASGEDEGAAATAVVVRAGEHGCFAVSDRSSCWLPAYHNASSSAKVVDTTGAGNAFLGAFAVAFHASRGDVREAAVRGTVAASFALEQVGLPEKTTAASSTSTSVDGRDLWNGDEFACRLREYRRRVDRA